VGLALIPGGFLRFERRPRRGVGLLVGFGRQEFLEPLGFGQLGLRFGCALGLVCGRGRFGAFLGRLIPLFRGLLRLLRLLSDLLPDRLQFLEAFLVERRLFALSVDDRLAVIVLLGLFEAGDVFLVACQPIRRFEALLGRLLVVAGQTDAGVRETFDGREVVDERFRLLLAHVELR